MVQQGSVNRAMTLDQERELVVRLKSGDRAALSTLYEIFGDKLYREAILPRLPIVELAEDVLATTFARAMERISQFTNHDRSVFFWLRRIAINLAMDAHRRVERDRRIEREATVAQEVAPPAPGADSLADQIEARELIEESLAMINPRYAKALRLRLLEDRDRADCAEELGITVGAFDVLLHRAAKAFREKYPPR